MDDIEGFLYFILYFILFCFFPIPCAVEDDTAGGKPSRRKCGGEIEILLYCHNFLEAIKSVLRFSECNCFMRSEVGSSPRCKTMP